MRKLAFVFILLILAIPCQARVITVDDDGPADFNNIQAGINDANDGDTVEVQPGTYTGPGNRDIDFLCKAIGVKSNAGPAFTIIDCKGTIAEPHRGFTFHSGEDANSVLDGFTIKNGHRTNGGGIYCRNSNPTIINCTFIGNSAGDGGAMFIHSNHQILFNCTFSGNAAGYGGGIATLFSNLTLSNCSFSNNSARLDGGGIYKISTSLTLTNNTFVGNSAKRKGAGIFQSWGGSLTLTNCILWNESDKQIEGPATVTYSDIKGGWLGDGNIDADPCFALSNDYHMMLGSPCIDAGDPNYIPAHNETDLDGNPRIISQRVDMGAYEYNPNSPSFAISASEISFSYAEGGSEPPPQAVLIRNCGGGTLNWEIIEDCNLLEVSQANGISNGQINKVTLRVEKNIIPPGSYFCILEVRDPIAINSPKILKVSFHVFTELASVPSQFSTIQDAIAHVVEGGMVVVADGIYSGKGNRGIDFHGKGITVRNENGPKKCIIDCETLSCGFCFHSGEGADSILEGFTITNGSRSSGGGIYCGGAGPTITNCIIANNLGTYGGAIYCKDGSLTLNNCSITNNLAKGGIIGGFGGGMYCGGSQRGGDFDISIINCTFSGNSAKYAGGIYYYRSCYSNGSLTIANCTFSGNTAGSLGGGGMFEIPCPTINDESERSNISSNDLEVISNCTFINNSAGYGGAIYCTTSSVTITNCDIIFNTAKRGGGVYGISSGEKVTNCMIIGNLASQKGGGIMCYGGDLTISDCIIIANISNTGGGIMCWRGASTEVRNCTFAENVSLYGNAVACDAKWQWEPKNNLHMLNCIIWDGGNEIWNNNNSTISISYSDIQDGWPGLGNINADPCFVDPGYWADGCDPNIIVEPNDPNAVWIDGDYHLLEDSPCIDAGDPNYIAGPNETDLDGNPRIVDGDNDGNSVVDMGAYERIPEPAELIAELLEEVGELGLPRGIENSLMAKLNAALGALEDENENNDAAAIHTLQAFINAVEAQRGKKIPEAEADALIAAAQEIIELLSLLALKIVNRMDADILHILGNSFTNAGNLF